MKEPPEPPNQLKIPLALITALTANMVFAQAAENNSFPYLQTGLILLGLLVLSGLISGAETALTAIGSWKIKHLQEEGKDPRGLFALLEQDRTKFITTLLIANNLANIAATAIVTRLAIQIAQANHFSEPLALGYTTGLMTLLILIFGEITPKSIAVHSSVAYARMIIRPVSILSFILYPVGRFFTFITSSILRIFKIEPNLNSLITENELRLMLRSAEEVGVIEEHEEEMIKGIIDLEETVVREVMTPRVDIVTIADEASLLDLLELTRSSPYSRLPVHQDTVDNIVGIVYSRDLLDYVDKPEKLKTVLVKDLMLTPEYVPETLSILQLLRDMRDRKNHMAIVVDEFGGTSGLITLEDIIEEITGEIYDETDPHEVEEIVDLGGGKYRLQATVHIDDAAEELDISFEDDGEFDTIAGFLTSQFGYIPKTGEHLQYQNVDFLVTDADERRIVEVEAQKATEQVLSELLENGTSLN